MQRAVDPVSATWLAALGVAAALGAAMAVAGLALSDPGDDIERISCLVSMLAAAATLVLLVALHRRRRAEIARLREDAAVVVYRLRAGAAAIAPAMRATGEDLPHSLRAVAQTVVEARSLAATVSRNGLDQDAIELRVALEAVELALWTGDPDEDEARP